MKNIYQHKTLMKLYRQLEYKIKRREADANKVIKNKQLLAPS